MFTHSVLLSSVTVSDYARFFVGCYVSMCEFILNNQFHTNNCVCYIVLT